jgi:hypothetical protein
MKTSLTEILRNALIGKKIKLYKILDKRHDKKGTEYYLTNLEDREHPTKCTVVDETHGFIKSIETFYETYDGDYYDVFIVDDNGHPLHVNGLYSITSELEIID